MRVRACACVRVRACVCVRARSYRRWCTVLYAVWRGVAWCVLLAAVGGGVACWWAGGWCVVIPLFFPLCCGVLSLTSFCLAAVVGVLVCWVVLGSGWHAYFRSLYRSLYRTFLSHVSLTSLLSFSMTIKNGI